MKDQWIKWRKSFPILRRLVMGLVILPPLVALPKGQKQVVTAPKAVEKTQESLQTKTAKKKKPTLRLRSSRDLTTNF